MMKKTLALLALAAGCYGSAYAWQEAVMIGYFPGAGYYDANTVFAAGEHSTLTIPYGDDAKTLASWNSDYRIKINDTSYTPGYYYTIAGESNPTNITIDTAPDSGWLFQIDPDADGWITFFSKFNSSKSYLLFESAPGQSISSAVLRSYSIGVYGYLDTNEAVHSYTMPALANGDFDKNAKDVDRYIMMGDKYGMQTNWIERIILGNDAIKRSATMPGVMIFPVKKGYTYYVSAFGSKINSPGYVMTSEEPESVIFEYCGAEYLLYEAQPAPDYAVSIGSQEVYKDGMTMLPLELDNTDDIIALQMDIKLGDGLSMAVDDEGTPLVESASRFRDHVLMCQPFDGGYRLLCYSATNNAIKGNVGTIVYLPILVDDQVQIGESRRLEITGIELTTKEGISKVELDDYATRIIVVRNFIPGDANGDGIISVSDITHIVAYILGCPSDVFDERAADMNGDGEISVTDITNVVREILSWGN